MKKASFQPIRGHFRLDSGSLRGLASSFQLKFGSNQLESGDFLQNPGLSNWIEGISCGIRAFPVGLKRFPAEFGPFQLD
jgi:hypothetical protein